MFRPYNIVVCALVACGAGMAGAVSGEFAPYQAIVDRAIFGKSGVKVEAVASVDAAAQRQMEQLARRMVMCAVNRTPSGNIAVGFIDNEAKPPRNLYMLVGETNDGYFLEAADYDEETATLAKDGVTITLKLGKGLVPTPTAPASPPTLSLAGAPTRKIAPPPSVIAGSQMALRSAIGRPEPARESANTNVAVSFRDKMLERKKSEDAEREAKARQVFADLAREVAAAEVQRQLLVEQGLTEDDLADFDDEEGIEGNE